MWITYKPYLANKHSSGESKIALTKRGESVTKVNKIVKAYSPYSASITDAVCSSHVTYAFQSVSGQLGQMVECSFKN